MNELRKDFFDRIRTGIEKRNQEDIKFDSVNKRDLSNQQIKQ